MNEISAFTIPKSKFLLVIFGFPIISTILSFFLLEKNTFEFTGLDFFSVFWLIIICWYVLQIFLVFKILNSNQLSLKDIGYSFNQKKTIYFILGYLVFAFALFGMVEYVLASENITSEKLNSLSDFSDLTPKTSVQRIIFIFAGLVAGISEELVYRGFVISAFQNYKVNKWLAIVFASIPFVFQHGLKSIDQFWWFFISGLVLGLIYILTKKKLYVTIIIHWIIILSAMLAILQVIE